MAIIPFGTMKRIAVKTDSLYGISLYRKEIKCKIRYILIPEHTDENAR